MGAGRHMDAQDTEAQRIRSTVEQVYRRESRVVLATLIRLLGDFDAAEEAMHDAFAAAMAQWPLEGIPAQPKAWLISTGRFKAIDAIRRRRKFHEPLGEHLDAIEADVPDLDEQLDAPVADDQLRLIFTCCHPALAPEARSALTLREVCGLTTEEIARAFLSSPPTIAQRIVRAKAKIREARIPYEVPAPGDLPERLDAVLQVIYLVFNEGYAASSGDALTRPDLSGEAIRLGHVLCALMPEPEVEGLLALMLLQESRRQARTDDQGDLVLLEDQDRSRWDTRMIGEGVRLVERALSSGRAGAYALQAAIAAVHAEAPTAATTDWAQIVALYDRLLGHQPSPVVELNRAVAVAMRDGPESGLALIDSLLEQGGLVGYHWALSAKGELCRRAGRVAEARSAYGQALLMGPAAPERRFLEKRLSQLA